MATHNILIDDHSLRVHPEGAVLLLHLPWYRSLWLSSVDGLEVSIDGTTVPGDRLRFELGGSVFRVDQLREQWDVLWFLSDAAVLVVALDEPLAAGSVHRVVASARLSLPYMQIKPETYVPQVVHQTRDLVVRTADEPVRDELRLETTTVEAVEAQPGEPFKLGLTLYSATSELNAGQYDLESLLDRVAAEGVGPGIEIVASQTLRQYPVVTPDFVSTWRTAFDRHGFEASAFGANLDMGRLRTRDMDDDEEYEFSAELLRGAHRLGFPLMRIQSARRTLLQRLLPLAESLDVALGYEIHAPSGPNAPAVQEIRELYAELDSPLLGFVADFSSTMHAMSPALLRTMRRMGLDAEATAELQRIWAQDAPGRERQGEFLAYLGSRGIDPGDFGSFAFLAFNMHGHVPVEEWADIMPQILHVHAKFYDIDDEGQEPAIDYPAIVDVFVRGGFRGYMSSEWEGHAFLDLGEVDPIALVRRQHNLIRRSMHASLAAV
ncbi:pyruvate formate-lyase [Rathayibacter sp. AY1F3]|uniref:C-glycoside deglycosidase beta subunit domain-containing protein n=1 Tax=Rathayibacter sp. AY1F3 TaxID=2080558 RepID=UPI000CE7FB8F|nr:DUF6379 domain-containing protein [Rathayibacter sp. AY1F3]PPG92760.1 pyruvate formate-lyase [Rathayibacter sp. AY1F3]